jgi:hypothetical protein
MHEIYPGFLWKFDNPTTTTPNELRHNAHIRITAAMLSLFASFYYMFPVDLSHMII